MTPNDRWEYLKNLQPSPGRYIHVSKEIEYDPKKRINVVSKEPGKTFAYPKSQFRIQKRWKMSSRQFKKKIKALRRENKAES